ncbi:Phytoene dehydrogenase family enzyme [Methanonatronarchaeum thermophilum]|uniref:Phytoene dehydrogenase family enzyme n=1 Tax=Methanonatronarchaeum thermophilum TaxID=1927129 RepID=A0A1Y3GBJ1_9EURY|nr:NAD(P)/FAD-dependent oxidoreductase [Methanonatronarchaeum thermophilum]OUJ18789.1 Phytoene dehydrogenase family enzyme [Methanonatronarchaeum thermophilum]
MKEKALVIGAGLGGLSAAITLATEGYEVEIYEKNSHIGGKLNQKTIEGYKFDLGPSILTMPHIFEQLFEKAGENLYDHISTTRLDPQWRCFFEDGTQIDLHDNIDKMDSNPEITTKDVKQLKEYMDYSRKLYETAEKGYFKEGLDTMKEVTDHYGKINALRKFDYLNTMQEGINKRVTNPYLQNIMGFFIKYVGSSSLHAPAVLNMLPHIQYEYGLHYIDGGMYNLAIAIQKILDKHNIPVHKNVEITKLKTTNNKITHAILDNSEEIPADLFISNMETVPTYRDLTKDKELATEYDNKYEASCSGLVIHLGVDKEYPMLQHHNFFFSKNQKEHFQKVFKEHKIPDDPTIYLVAPKRTDPNVAPEGHDNLKILPHIPHLTDKPPTPQQYQQLKQKVLNKLERMGLKDLQKHIVYEEHWTPRNIKKLYKSNRGSIYGVVSDKKKNKGFKSPKKSTKYQNLYFVGGSVNPGAGMPMVTLSGQKLHKKIN